MPKIKKTLLRNILLECIQVLKPSLPYVAYRQLLLTLFFLRRVIVSPHQSGIFSPATITDSITQSITEIFDTPTNSIQSKLRDALLDLEGLSPALEGVLSIGIPDQIVSDEDLARCWDLLGQLQRETGVFTNAELFPLAYENWLVQIAQASSRRNVDFFTPRGLTRLLSALIRPAPGMSIYDPSVRTGGMLLGCVYELLNQQEAPQTLNLIGFEPSEEIWAICKMNLYAHGMILNSRIERAHPLRVLHADAEQYDIVLQNLPLVSDGKKKQIQSDTNYLHHILEVVAPTGRAAILSPAHIQQTDMRIFWDEVLQHDWLESVIGIPPRQLQGTSASACIIIINKQKPQERKQQVQFIQLAGKGAASAWHPTLRDDDIQQIVKAYTSWRDVPDLAHIVPINRIAEQNYNLNPARYMEWAKQDGSTMDIETIILRYQSAVEQRNRNVAQLLDSLGKLWKYSEENPR
jgi:type I restriction enzyme M protein